MAKEKTKIKRKEWVRIIAPKIFKEQLLGEINLVEHRLAVGRAIKVNLMDLTSDIRKQNIGIVFEIIKIEDNKAITEPISYKISTSSIKRLVRRGKEKIEDSFVCVTSDNKSVKIKPFMITRFDAKKSVLTALRKLARELLTNEIKKLNYTTLFSTIVSYGLQKKLMAELGRIYPLRMFEIREIKIEREKVRGEVAQKKAKEEEPKTVEKDEKIIPDKGAKEEKDKKEGVKEKSEGDAGAKTDN